MQQFRRNIEKVIKLHSCFIAAVIVLVFTNAFGEICIYYKFVAVAVYLAIDRDVVNLIDAVAVFNVVQLF